MLVDRRVLKLLRGLSLPIAVFALALPIAAQDMFGRFSGQPIVELQSDGRKIKLLVALEFTDADGLAWVVPAGYISDGASIPRLFWTPVGGPLDGAYRDAAIIHDYYCEHYAKPWPEDYKRDWQRVHRAFYYGIRARGVAETKAKLMYGAVYYFGPRWEWSGDRVRLITAVREQGGDRNPEDEVYAFIEQNNPSLEQIESYKSERMNIRFEPGAWQLKSD
jgi:Protein of unknown function (DUF1353)